MTQRSPIGPIQKALYTWLSADSALAALAPVYDNVVQPTPYPYVEIAEFSSTKNDSLGDQGRDVIVTLFTFSQNPGFLELETIAQELLRLLDETSIPNTSAGMDPSLGWQIWDNQVILEEAIKTRMPDGLTRQYALRVRVSVSKIALGE